MVRCPRKLKTTSNGTATKPKKKNNRGSCEWLQHCRVIVQGEAQPTIIGQINKNTLEVPIVKSYFFLQLK